MRHMSINRGCTFKFARLRSTRQADLAGVTFLFIVLIFKRRSCGRVEAWSARVEDDFRLHGK